MGIIYRLLFTTALVCNKSHGLYCTTVFKSIYPLPIFSSILLITFEKIFCMYSSCLMLRVSEIEHRDSNLFKIQKLVAETDEMAKWLHFLVLVLA